MSLKSRLRWALFVLVCLVAPGLAEAANVSVTTPLLLSSTTFVDLGTAPVQVQALNNPVTIIVADSQPSVGSVGNALQNGPALVFYPIDAGSHVWAAMLGQAGTISYAPVTGVGGGSSAAPATVVQAPYGYTSTGPEQHNIPIASATGLTVPAGTTYAIVQAKTAAVQYTLDGATTPTSTIGFTLAVGPTLSISGASLIANFKAISATGTIDAGFYK